MSNVRFKQLNLNAGGDTITNHGTPSASTDVSTKGYVDGEVTALTSSDKAQNPTGDTSGDNETTGITIASTPAKDGYVVVKVNGASYEVGDGVKTKDCYFSSDSGTTAKSIADITSGDELIWNGVISGFDLLTTDSIDFEYVIAGVSSASLFGDLGNYIPLETPTEISGWIGPTQTSYANVDVSSNIPAGSIAVVVRVLANVVSSASADLRVKHPNGTDNVGAVAVRPQDKGGSVEISGRFVVAVDSDRIFQAKYDVSHTNTFDSAWIVGYYVKNTASGSPIMLDDPVEITGWISSGTTTFTDVDISSLVPTASSKVIIRSVLDSSATNTSLKVRVNGSTADSNGHIVHSEVAGDSLATSKEWTVQTDSSGIFEAKFRLAESLYFMEKFDEALELFQAFLSQHADKPEQRSEGEKREHQPHRMKAHGRADQTRLENVALEELKEGDLVFFKIRKGRISHVGIYLKDGYFAHATTYSGVTVSHLSEKYYTRYFFKGGRPSKS